MESRNVKIIDEHGIDRDARILCGLKIENVNYVLYAIERDSENDNLFVSKIINNFDGTSNMINIEDSLEKNRINSIVKELVTYAINNEADKTTGTVKLSNGSDVEINSVLFNKEQNINVTKTYITTVKKSVTKVSETFYELPMKEVTTNTESTFFDTVKDDIFETQKNESDPVMPSVSEPTVVEPISVVPPVLPEVNLTTPVVDTPAETPVVEPTPVVSPVVDNSINTSSTPVDVTPVASPSIPESAPVATPIFDTTSAIPGGASVSTPDSNNLVFDGSKETNLNEALGEVSSANTVPVGDVNPLREFGQSDNQVSEVAPALNNDAVVQPATSNGGFAKRRMLDPSLGLQVTTDSTKKICCSFVFNDNWITGTTVSSRDAPP